MSLLKRVLFAIVFYTLLPTICLADGYYRKHYHIVVDQTPDIQGNVVNSAIESLLEKLKFEFNNSSGELYFDSLTDEMSLYVFGLSGSGMGDSLNNSSSYGKLWSASRSQSRTSEQVYNLFVSSFIQPRANSVRMSFLIRK